MALGFCTALGQASVITVTTLEDLDQINERCSLREAIIAANTNAVFNDCTAGSGTSDVIEFRPSGTITLTSPLPEITDALTLQGNGAGATTIDGAGHGILEFMTSVGGDGEDLRLVDLRLTGGARDDGAALLVGDWVDVFIEGCLLDGNHATGQGGAVSIDNVGRLEIDESTFQDNSSGAQGGAIAAGRGTVEIATTTFTGNAAGGDGGAIWVESNASFSLRLSTLHDNHTAGSGGGIALDGAGGMISIRSTTITANGADSDNSAGGDGGGLAVLGTPAPSLLNVVVAENIDGTVVGTNCPDLATAPATSVASSGYNLVGDHSCVETWIPLGTPNGSFDLVGDSTTPLDPQLEPLDDNGGPTSTRVPGPTSPAVDQGSCPTDNADQRGYSGSGGRPFDTVNIPDRDDGCDIGSVERNATAPGVAIGLIFADGFESGSTSAWSEVGS